jgi:hypothetical protein
MDEIFNLVEDIKGTGNWLWELAKAVAILCIPLAILIALYFWK